MKIAAGMILGILIGSACRWFDIPAPSPPKLIGALLVVAMTVGYTATDKVITTRSAVKQSARTRDLSGGPTDTPTTP